MSKALAFIVSDSIGETARQVVEAAATQFNSTTSVEFERFSYVTDYEDVSEVIKEAKDQKSLIAFTLINPDLREYLKTEADEADIEYVDIMGPMMQTLANVLNISPKLQPGLVRKLDEEYFKKVDAIEFTVKYDDRNDIEGIYKSDIVLVGISRTSKTPMSIYLSYRGYKVANIPLVPEVTPPEVLFDNPSRKVIGLTIDSKTLNGIRQERLKSLGLNVRSDYASLKRISKELNYAANIFRRIGCPVVDVSNKSVEESANTVLKLIRD
ncbi:pyruvate, water dikinase regulatory protein [Sporohalobacter salinus]|uniref:pyruvate, water dikinase regulatory protein n=1 Tax=Sporohalobacter salinus TaxID=1494606 RepID=UPI001961D397|nr:pyruvate, water dikinase regulatory protein [Sporohalobacter salinus]MBM7623188.1 regulator of PEP synthase PpsR (kinase-PPPase family) [Sporohalobacter salinus]